MRERGWGVLERESPLELRDVHDGYTLEPDRSGEPKTTTRRYEPEGEDARSMMGMRWRTLVGAGPWRVLALLLAAAFALRIVVAATLPNLCWPDEVFQTSEQGHRLAFGPGLVSWEFREGT